MLLKKQHENMIDRSLKSKYNEDRNEKVKYMIT